MKISKENEVVLARGNIARSFAAHLEMDINGEDILNEIDKAFCNEDNIGETIELIARVVNDD